MSGSALSLAGADKKDQVNDLLGVWTVVHSEVEGDAAASLRNPAGRPPAGDRGTVMPPMVWKIARENIDEGWENLNFPSARHKCQWNPGGETGTVNLTALDRQGKKLQPEPSRGIYLRKGDVLIICYSLDNTPRPARFTTAAKSKSVLVMLRRGK
jgi:hypothetical protein